MKYLIAAGISGFLFLGLHSPTISSNYWHKLLFNKEDTKEQKKREFKVITIIWAIATVIIFLIFTFTAD